MPAPCTWTASRGTPAARSSGIASAHARSATTASLRGSNGARSTATRFGLPQPVTLPRPSPSQRVLPGLVDLHIHAPQWPQLGTGLDLPLERWLFEYTFPLEARFADTAFAREVWAHMVPTLLAHGTTTAVYFGSVHEAATLAARELPDLMLGMAACGGPGKPGQHAGNGWKGPTGGPFQPFADRKSVV